MAFRTSKISSVDDTPDPTRIQPSDVNPESIPSTPADGDLRVERTGTSPNRFLRLYTYDSGGWQLMAEAQI